MNDEYAKALLDKVRDLEVGLKYYIEKSHTLENELNVYKEMYENRVNECLKKEK